MKSRAETFASIQEKSQRALAERERNRKNIVKISLTAACLVLMVSAALPRVLNQRFYSEKGSAEYTANLQEILEDDLYGKFLLNDAQCDAFGSGVIDFVPEKSELYDVSRDTSYQLNESEAMELYNMLNAMILNDSDAKGYDADYIITFKSGKCIKTINVYSDAILICDTKQVKRLDCTQDELDEFISIIKGLCLK